MVYEDIFDAKNACDHLSGFNVCNRYLVVLYYNANRVSVVHSTERLVLGVGASSRLGRAQYLLTLVLVTLQAFQKMDTKKKEEQLKLLKEKYGINTDPPK